MTTAALNQRYTFENFVVGTSNRQAQRAALKLCENLGTVHNPFFIFGGVGLGKTHLMQAIGRRLSETRPQLKVHYVTSEKFTNELMQAVARGGVSSFHRSSFNIDALLIDDIHFVSGKERTQDEFFKLFNLLHKAGKQIIISSDRHPREIPKIQKKLIARFSCGLTAELKPPDMKMRLAILEEKSRMQKFHLPRRIARIIALRIRSNIRKLEGALNKVIAFQRIAQEEIAEDMLDKFLGELMSEEDARVISIDRIQRMVATRFEIKLSALLSTRRTWAISRPRQIAMYLSRKLIGCSFSEIGQAFGDKNHATVLYACRTIEAALRKDRPLAAQLEELEDEIKGRPHGRS